MKHVFERVMVVLAVLSAFTMVVNVAFALKNVCPDCRLTVEDMELTACPACGKIINKCLICGVINPVKNDNCSSCNASLAESRVLRTIDKQTREELRLGESDRAKIEVELGQIKNIVEEDKLTAELAAREVELLTKMDWWSKANLKALEFTRKFPDAPQKNLVNKCRVKCLRTLGFLAMEDSEFELAITYLKAALEIAPEDKNAAHLLKMSLSEVNPPKEEK